MVKDPEIERLKAGDENAFRDMVLAFKDRVVNLCWGFVQNGADAEDVSQEVFLEVHRSIASFRGEAKLATWIYRIAVTKSLEHLRKRKRRRWFAMLAGKRGEDIDRIKDESRDADEAVEKERRMRLLVAAMEKLPESQRIALSLRSFEGLGYREIGEVMDVSVPSVESLIFRAKSNLKKRLARELEKKMKP
jgi:RNA polymerase sigma factor (sigma-70 family)